MTASYRVERPDTVRSNVSSAKPAFHSFIVIDGRKWIVEMMQQLLPLLVLRRLSESFLVGGNTVPAHEKEIVAFALEAPLELVRLIPRHRGNDRLCFAKCGFECRRMPGSHL